MTIGELKAILNQYSDDMPVRITYECDNRYRDITKIKTVGKVTSTPFVSIQTNSVPDYEDLATMAEESLEIYNSVMMRHEIDALSGLVGDYCEREN